MLELFQIVLVRCFTLSLLINVVKSSQKKSETYRVDIFGTRIVATIPTIIKQRCILLHFFDTQPHFKITFLLVNTKPVQHNNDHDHCNNCNYSSNYSTNDTSSISTTITITTTTNTTAGCMKEAHTVLLCILCVKSVHLQSAVNIAVHTKIVILFITIVQMCKHVA